MSINVSQSFHRTSANAVDDTLTLTKSEMLTVNDNLMPSKYLTVCQDDGFIYLYDKSATPNSTTGKFTKFEGGGGVASALNDLTDVTISSAAQNQILKYNGSGWVNSSIPEDTTKYGTSDSASTDLADADYIPFYDSSASAKKKTLWSNIKTVLANTFQPKLTAGNNITITDNTISASAGAVGVWARSDIYSTTEKVVGCWTDGKPIYKKTYTGTLTATSAVGTETTTMVSLGATVDSVILVSGTVKNPAGTTFQNNTTIDLTNNRYIRTSVDNNAGSNKNYLFIYNAWFTSASTYYITIYYTKTTDAANSYNYSDENDYSTSEKLIGKWIDGSNLYQRTFTGTTNSSGDTTEISIGTIKIKDIRGIISWDSTTLGQNVFAISMCATKAAGDTEDLEVSIYTDSNKLIILACQNKTGTNYRNKAYAITIKYTK